MGEPETRNPKPEARSLKPKTRNSGVRPKTRNPKPKQKYMTGPETQDSKRETQEFGVGTSECGLQASWVEMNALEAHGSAYTGGLGAKRLEVFPKPGSWNSKSCTCRSILNPEP